MEMCMARSVHKIFTKNQHSPLDSANDACYITYRTKEERKIKDLLEFGSKNENNNSWHICQVKNGGMTYVNAQCIWKRYF